MSAPPPLTTTDMDVRDLDGFMLNSERLLASELWAMSTGEEFKAAVGLWCRAWKQIPAGSVPNDDRVLASFAGVTTARWKKVRVMALRGFVLCADGRLYHSTLCQDVHRGYGKKQERRAQTHAANEARKQRNAQRDDSRNDPRNVGRNVHPVTGQGQGQDRTGKTGESAPDPDDLFAPQAGPRPEAIQIPYWLDLGSDRARADDDRTAFRELVVKYPAARRIGEELARVEQRKVYVRELVAAVLAETAPTVSVHKPTTSLYDQAAAIAERDGWEACRARLDPDIRPRIRDAKSLDDVLDGNPEMWARQLLERSGKGAA